PRKGFFAGPRFGSPVAYTDANTPKPLKPHEAPFTTDTQDQGSGWFQSYFYNGMNKPEQWNYVGGYTGYYHTFRHPGNRANMHYMDGHVASILPVYMGGPLGWRLIWNYAP